MAWGGDRQSVLRAGLLSPLHHQNVPQKLPAEMKPGIKLELRVPAQSTDTAVSDKNHAGENICLIRLCGGGGKDQPARLSASTVLGFLFQLSSPFISGQ